MNSEQNTLQHSEPVNLAVLEHVSKLPDQEWKHAHLGQDLYRFFGIFNEAFFESQLSAPIISIEGSRVTKLGGYRIGRNGFGAKNHININARHLNQSKVEILSTLVHEMVHQWQHEVTMNAAKPPYHNIEFQKKSLDLGIPSDSYGHQLSISDPFIAVCRANGLEIDEKIINAMALPHRPILRGNSKLKKWSCGCTNVRVAVADFEAMCLKCNNMFVQVA